MDCARRTEGTVRVTENNTVNVTRIYDRWTCRSSKNYCKDTYNSVDSFMLLCFYVNLRCCTTSFMDSLHENSDWRHGFTAAWQSGGAAGATHVQISWISTWIPSEVTRTFFFDLPIWDSNSSSFSCRSFSSQREPTVVGSIIYSHWYLYAFFEGTHCENHVTNISIYLSVTYLNSENVIGATTFTYEASWNYVLIFASNITHTYEKVQWLYATDKNLILLLELRYGVDIIYKFPRNS